MDTLPHDSGAESVDLLQVRGEERGVRGEEKSFELMLPSGSCLLPSPFDKLSFDSN